MSNSNTGRFFCSLRDNQLNSYTPRARVSDPEESNSSAAGSPRIEGDSIYSSGDPSPFLRAVMEINEANRVREEPSISIWQDEDRIETHRRHSLQNMDFRSLEDIAVNWTQATRPMNEIQRVFEEASQTFEPLSPASVIIKPALYHSVIFRLLSRIVDLPGNEDLAFTCYLYDSSFSFQGIESVTYNPESDSFTDSRGSSYTFAIPMKLRTRKPYSCSNYIGDYSPPLHINFFREFEVRSQLTSNQRSLLQSLDQGETLSIRAMDQNAAVVGQLPERYIMRHREPAIRSMTVDRSLFSMRPETSNSDNSTLSRMKILTDKKVENAKIEDVMQVFSELFSNFSDIVNFLNLPSEDCQSVITGLDSLKVLFENNNPKLLNSILNIPEEVKPQLLKSLRDQIYTFSGVSSVLKTEPLNVSLTTFIDVKWSSRNSSSNSEVSFSPF